MSVLTDSEYEEMKKEIEAQGRICPGCKKLIKAGQTVVKINDVWYHGFCSP